MSLIDDFKQFALRGNIVDMAVGFTVGAAFTTIAKSLVDDLINPLIGLAVGKVDFTNFFILLKPGVKMPPPYTTLAEAKTAGAVTWNIGSFLNNVITFLLIALAMFLLLRLLNDLEKRLGAKKEAAAPTTKDCPFCFSAIPLKATRCPQCTSQLDAAPAAA
ncbi:MAG TPA: large conductance mechanosensitive channel protein MscL [Planktothrix sp.]|jgi:large conductance mechanosensitive channel